MRVPIWKLVQRSLIPSPAKFCKLGFLQFSISSLPMSEHLSSASAGALSVSHSKPNAARSANPSGTPIPAPIAASLLEDDGDDDDVSLIEGEFVDDKSALSPWP